MSSAEKAYVKRYGYKGQAREKAYWRLFDAMDRQEQYDEPALRLRFAGGEGFRSFPAAKRHLQERILAALMEYHAGKNLEDRLLQHTREAWFLLDRGLDALASKRLDAAWKIAGELGDPVFEAPLFQMGGMLLPYTPDAFGQRMDLLDREAVHAQNLGNRTAYRKLYARMTALVGKWGVIARDPQHVQEVDELLAEPLLNDAAMAKGFMAKYLLHSINKILHQIVCRYPQSLEASRQLVALYEAHPEQRQRQPEHYFMAVSNLLIDLVGMRAFEEFDATAELLDGYLSRLPEGRIRREGEGNRLGRILYRQLVAHAFEGALETAEALRAYDDAFAHQPHVSIQHQYLRTCAYAYVGRFDEALRELVYLLQNPMLPHHADYHGFSMILNLILHLELGHNTHLPYAVERTRRALKARQEGFAVERLFLRFLKDRERAGSNPAMEREAYARLRDGLEPLQQDPYERNAFHYFDYLLWIDAHLAGMSMQELADRQMH